jgi:hypothetical protein
MKRKRHLYLLPHERYLGQRFISTEVLEQYRQRYGPDAAAINVAYRVDGMLGVILSSIGIIGTVIAVIFKMPTVGYVAICVWCAGMVMALAATARAIQAFIVLRNYRRELRSEHLSQ